jgi:pantoate--beta-alanine ligase
MHFPALLQSRLSPEKITEQLKTLGFRVDYIAEKWHRRLGAVWLDDVRLIDNVPL